MIKRIISINNVGSFREFDNGGSIQFEKLTFIYGLNTRGKSTLTDILTSLKDNDPSFITTRKSIPNVPSNQGVRISVRPHQSTNEVPCIFSNTSWTQVHSNDYLHIFGSDFIHKNLFTGLSIERQNKENFTRFILGQQGVQLATQIAEDKRVLRQKKSNLPNLLPLYLRGKQEQEYAPFLTTDPNSINIEDKRQQLSQLEQRLRQEQQRLQRPTEILSIEDFSQFIVPTNNIQDLTNQTNVLLESEFNEISSAAIAKLQEHIENNFEITENATQWIKEGLDTRKNDSNNCSFCGQSLENATDLLNAYHSYFNEAYREYISDIENKVENLRRQWGALNYNSLNLVIAKQALLLQYTQLINTEDFTALVTRLNELIDSANETGLNDLTSHYSQQVIQAFNIKERKPHEPVQSIDFTGLLESHVSYQSNLSAIAETIESIREAIQLFKEPYRDLSQIRTKISELQTEIEIKKRAIARVEQNDACVSYQAEQREITVIETRIIANEQALSANQNQYLDRFYTRIDFHFKQFGSENFTLERGTDNRGHQPVYFLKVKFKNVEINDSNITKVFSESDKRALALSLFWARLDFLSPDEKQRAIIVLDDPVTSFDDNRILKSINRIKETLRSVSQIVVLTHYSHFIRNFLERAMNDDFPISFIEIAQNDSTSFLRRIESKTFTETTYERVVSKIYRFINRESEEDIRTYLRTFLESQYFPHFYIGKLIEFEQNGITCSNLSDKIDQIFSDKDVVRAKFHEFRTTLNGDNHIFTSSNEEDIRSFAREMMDYLYNFSHDV
ncbi:MAG: AAA family ATPase [Bacteroidota bacterium]|uniref:AAA family ATPase n=1 Tax=Hydrotalea lipotrueae TaxID=2803817 RepID=UPI001C4686FD|nr:AAA family ATPase [Hydrotalea lipotrueae]